MWGMGGHMGWGWFGAWWILIVIIVIVLFFVINPSRRGGWRQGDSAEETLKRRYARGEIDRETYVRMLEDLRK